ncbi:DUF3558 domain-containing protein [Nocardia mexicana]|uniref:DUF3558 domain-containing protein n=1 Tax=Nocardia mexicana TaxID=279262 RepID=UPI001472360C|nr:DUF3558 domain-containing protein [Nocardia mexicana]
MKRIRQSGCFAALAAAAVLVTAGCTSDNGDPTDTASESASATAGTSAKASPRAPQPTLTAPSLQPPPQKQYGRPDVAFDPCTWIPDDVIAQAGFDPSSRKRHDRVAEITFLNCDFSSKTRNLSVISGNATWDEDLQKNRAWIEPITINGREAMWVRDPGLARGCDIHLRTKAGFVDLGTTVLLGGLSEGVQPCDGLLDIATAIEPTIGKDN